MSKWSNHVLKVTLSALLIFSASAWANDKDKDKDEYEFKRPEAFEFITNVPQTYKTMYGQATDKNNFPIIAATIASTALLVYNDRALVDLAQKLGRKTGLGNHDHTKTFITGLGFNIFRGPTDTGSYMYFIGDGWLHIGIIGAFFATGTIIQDNRALQTASQIAHGIVAGTLTGQIIKRTTGREDPVWTASTTGKWHFFPNQKEYGEHVSQYDAFPSGHLQATMMTYTVIAENYPEYAFIKPLGYTLMGLLSYQMLNIGVHWASDYPLALLMGYAYGKIAVNYGKKLKAKAKADSVRNEKGELKVWTQVAVVEEKSFFDSVEIIPVLERNNIMALILNYNF